MILKGSATAVTSATTLGRATRIRVGATNAGTVTIAAGVGTFNAASAVDGAAITVTGHPFTTGQEVVYSDGGGTAIAELTDGGKFYVRSVDANTINLATSSRNAENGVVLTLTDGPSQNHTVTATDTYAGSVVLIQNDVLLIDKKPSDTIACGASMSCTSIGNQP
tara:strand:- start:49 stop:543 length:495 start_codon:yes stop_codon:yes gene_type:complete